MKARHITFETPNRHFAWTLLISDDKGPVARIDSLKSFPMRADANFDLANFIANLKLELEIT